MSKSGFLALAGLFNRRTEREKRSNASLKDDEKRGERMKEEDRERSGGSFSSLLAN